MSKPANLRVCMLHLLCFALPGTTLVYLLTAPHSGWGALAWFGVVLGVVLLDDRAGSETRQPAPDLPSRPFDGMLYSLCALQAVNLWLGFHVIATHGFWRADLLVTILMVGSSSAYSGIVVGHELIHRSEPHMKMLGRVLMGLVLYEHFYTEHLRGHHRRIGTAEDPATARFGERLFAFRNRAVVGQWKSAWRLETTRLGDAHMRITDRRQVGNRVLHGLVAEWGFAAVVAVVFGPAAFAFHLIQAWFAVGLLEAVNFFEHWGLERQGARVTTVDSWDATSAFTLYTLVGLSRHADHHAHASKPFQQLRHFEESPKLPSGYFGSFVLATFRPARFEELMTEELRRRRLGPFRDLPLTPDPQSYSPAVP